MRLRDEKSAQGLLVTNDPFYIARRVQLAILAARYAVPTIYPYREMAEAGGLLSYGSNLAERDRQAGIYVGRILKGEKPADLPVQQMSKFELENRQGTRACNSTRCACHRRRSEDRKSVV